MLREERDADARLDVDDHLLELERLAQRVGDPVCQRNRVLPVASGAHERELVAAETSDLTVAADRCAEALRDLHEQQVPVAVPERVVDLLEPVEVHQQHAGRDALVVDARR